MDDDLRIDPGLRQQLLLLTGATAPPAEGEAAADERIAVVARLTSAGAQVPGLEPVARFDDVVTARVRLADVFRLRRHPAVLSLKASRTVGPGLAGSVGDIRARPADLQAAGTSGLTGHGLTGHGVVVAVLDWGLDFAHANLRHGDGSTRLLALWDQRGAGTPTSPQPYGYGRVHTRADVDAWLRSTDPYGHGYDPADIDPHGHGTHGTHVTDIAVGCGRAPGASPGVAPGADLLFVHLRGDDTRPEDDLGDSVRLLEGMRWAVDAAGDRPVVVHLSLGRTGGPHDPSPLVSQAMDRLLLSRPGVAVVMSCGNYYETRMHAGGRVPVHGTATLDWQVRPPGHEPSELEVWYGGADRLRVTVDDPSGRQVAELAPDSEAVVRDPSGQVLLSAFHRSDDPGNGAHHVDLFLWTGAAPGTWRVTLHGVAVVDGRYDAWIERTDPAHQSQFSAASSTPDRTTGSICNGWQPLAVGAYDSRDRSAPIGPFSSSGPTRDGRAKPDLSAPGVGIRAARSSAPGPDGHRSHDGLTVKSGTSMAAPHVTGAVALLFEAMAPWRLPMAVTRWILMESARHDPPASDADRLRYGAGRIDVAAACTIAHSLRGQLASAVAVPVLVGGAAHPGGMGALPSRGSESAAEEVLGRLLVAGTAVDIVPTGSVVRAADADAATRAALRRTSENTFVRNDSGPGGRTVQGFAAPAGLPTPVTAGVQVDPTVTTLVVGGGRRVYVPADPAAPGRRWVDVPGLTELYALPATDLVARIGTWATRTAQATPGLTTAAARQLGVPLLRATLAQHGAAAFPVSAVHRGTAQTDAGGIVNGITVPGLRLPVTEPHCYLPVIAEVEGKLESINGWDMGAGVSLGPIQFNTDRGALHRFLWRLWADDPDLFTSALGRPLGWAMSWHADHGDLAVTDTAGPQVLHGTAADAGRCATYLQSGTIDTPARDGPWRRRVTGCFRDAVVWPHVQEMVVDVSTWWLAPALRRIQAAGIGPLDPRRPDRATFLLTALLLSAAVRFSASLDPILRELRPWPGADDKLAHLPDAVTAAGPRFAELGPRLTRQRAHAEHVHDQIDRLLGAPVVPPSETGSGSEAEVIDATVATPAPSTRWPPSGSLLTAAASSSAQAWNAANHPARSGATDTDIAACVAIYVDTAATAAQVTAAGAAPGTAPWTAALVESLHQFQRATYAEPAAADGKAGPSTLDTLGLVRRSGNNPVRQSNAAAQARLTTAGDGVRTATGGEFSSSTWWEGMVDPAFLGRQFSNGVHLLLARRLRTAERHLRGLPAYAGLTPAALGLRLGITEEHKGARPTARTASMHTYGLAVDISYTGNPWIVGQHVDRSASGTSPAGAVTETANRRMTDVVGRAALLVDGDRIHFDGSYLSALSSRATADVWDDLHRRDQAFRRYLELAAHPDRAEPLVRAAQRAGTPGVLQPGETIAAAAARWARQAADDLAALRAGSTRAADSQGTETSVDQSNFSGRDPLLGFLNLDRDLVVALREVAGLAWGAVDFGARESGDVMHFDVRRDGVGQLLYGTR